MVDMPKIMEERVDGKSFLDAILLPHTCYYKPLRAILSHPAIHGMAHITGGGIEGNLKRIFPEGTEAWIDLSKINVLPIFSTIRRYGRVPDEDMLQTFNMGVGLTMVAEPGQSASLITHLAAEGCAAYEIGEIVEGARNVSFTNHLAWDDID